MKTVTINGKEQVYLSPKEIRECLQFCRQFANTPKSNPMRAARDKLAANLKERGLVVD